MNRLNTRHPAEDQLFRFADGELPAREAASVRKHLEACWECRAGLEEFQKTVSECVRYRKNVLEPYLPSPPAPWGDLQRRFDNIDAADADRSFFSRFGEIIRAATVSPSRWAPAAVALVLIAAIVYQLRDTPSVRAAELLRKAVTAAESKPQAPRRIQIRTRKQRFTRIIAAGAIQPAESGSLQNLFESARYSWDDPLSARSFESWRNQLADRKDEVIAASDHFQIRTTTGSGELTEATLKLNHGDLRPVEGTLHFRNDEWVEMREIPADPGPAVASASALPNSTIPASPAPSVGPIPAEATVGQELQAFAALHRIGADLGDPIEISRASGHVVVTGTGLDLDRKREIQQALAALPNVALRFEEAEATAPAPEPRTETGGSGNATPALQAKLEQYAGSEAALEKFVAQTLELSDTMMARAYALRTLAQRFPESIETQMSVDDRKLLANLQQAHAVALLQRSGDLQRTMNPLLASLGAPPSPLPPTGPPANWQQATTELFRSAQTVETLLASLLGGAPAATTADRLPAELLSALDRLRANSQAYSSLIHQPPIGKD